jgi:hypothetical protein
VGKLAMLAMGESYGPPGVLVNYRLIGDLWKNVQPATGPVRFTVIIRNAGTAMDVASFLMKKRNN